MKKNEWCIDTKYFIFCPQVRSDYLKELAERVDPDVAIQLGCIEMR